MQIVRVYSVREYASQGRSSEFALECFYQSQFRGTFLTAIVYCSLVSLNPKYLCHCALTSGAHNLFIIVRCRVSFGTLWIRLTRDEPNKVEDPKILPMTILEQVVIVPFSTACQPHHLKR